MNNKEIWRQNILCECFLCFVSLWVPLTQFCYIALLLFPWGSKWLGQSCQCLCKMAQGLRHQVEELWEELSRLWSNRGLTESSQTPKDLSSSLQGSKDSKSLWLNRWKNDTPRMEALGRFWLLASGDRWRGKFQTELDPSCKLTAIGTAGGAGITSGFMSMDPS